MSATIQTQFSIVHIDSQVPVPASSQRTTYEDTFSLNIYDADTVDATVDLGSIITPRQFAFKLVSGDDVLIGFDGSSYPIRLSGAGDGAIIPVDVAGLVETSTIVVTAEDANTTLEAKSFRLEGNSGTWDIWFDISGTASDPDGTTDSAIQITGIAVAATAATVGAALYAQMIANTAFVADFSVAYDSGTDTLTITDRHTGTRANIADGSATTGFAFATTQAGAASPVTHYKSTGSSSVLISVAPN